MIYLKKYNESNSVTTQEIYEDFLDCFIDLIDNDDKFDKESLTLILDKNLQIRPLVDELWRKFNQDLSSFNIKKIYIEIGYNIIETDINNLDDYESYESFLKELEKSRKLTKFLEELKISIDKFKGLYNSLCYLDYSNLDMGYIKLEFIVSPAM